MANICSTKLRTYLTILILITIVIFLSNDQLTQRDNRYKAGNLLFLTTNSTPVETYVENRERPFHLKSDQRLTCLDGVVTLIPGGRLANQIFEYANACYLAQILSYRCVIPRSTFKGLQRVFTNLSATVLEDEVNRGPCKTKNITANFVFSKGPKNVVDLKHYENWAKKMKQPIILWRWANIIELIVPNFKDVLKLFHTRPDVESGAQKILENIKSTLQHKYNNHEVLFIGIHVRRTDMLRYIKLFGVTAPAGVDYYRHAVADMRKYFSGNNSQVMAFVLASDDVKWCKKNIIPELQNDLMKGHPPGDIFFADDGSFKSPAHDLTTLSMCNHSIMSYGTFGMWAAMKAGGRTIIYNTMNPNNPNAKPFITINVLQYLPNWKAIT